MDIVEFKELKKELLEELKLENYDMDNLTTKSERIPNLYQKYLDIFMTESCELSMLEVKMKKTFGELLHHYKYKDDYSWENKWEVEAKIDSDKKYYQLKTKFVLQEAIVDFLEKSLKNIKEMRWDIKSIIDIKKFNAGMG